MSDKVKHLAPQIWSEIQKANSILLTCHCRPDPDSVASVLAMKLSLEKLGKKVVAISGDDSLPRSMSFLKGVSEIQTKNITQVELLGFDLFLILDSAAPEQITKKVSLLFPLAIKSIVIDHHNTNSGFGDINWIESEIGSTAELIYELLSFQELSLVDSDIATCIFVGMWSDTLGFSVSSVTAETYQIASELIAKGADFKIAITQLQEKPLKALQLLGAGLSKAKCYFNGEVIVAKVPYATSQEQESSKNDITEMKASLAYELSRCEDARIIAVIYEYEPGKTNISMRANNPQKPADVSKIAKLLGGGGHIPAASGKVDADVDTAEKEFLSAVQKTYPDLGQP